MRRQLGTLIGIGLVAPLAFAPPAAAKTADASVTAPNAAPNAAPKTAPKTAGATLDDPYSKFQVSLSYTKRTKRGGKITYSIRAKNLGPHYADYYWIGGQVPKGVKPTLYWDGPKGTKCSWEGQWFWCWGPYVLYKGQTDWLKFQVTLKKNTKGTAVAKLGILAYDVPTGATGLSEEELDRIGGVQGWRFLKTAKTAIVWPKPPRRDTGYTPSPLPPQPDWTPPKKNVERNEKKDT
ncbi:hypothetical protein HNP84_007421 [Thermocatellispora tengchongensis]|uniref:DUF11 domain-containing protein n=1 Tax=Thermocatellispora tengchongensis TaxID=1073253 RepID=A0A840PFA7_9ACTN|nr:hypothetical protein [Thermocatellispora tengchongensis]MBB5137669.1 hypothetical protein [Thermocatellispora tengchongensis]